MHGTATYEIRRSDAGQRAYLNGLSAEARVERAYLRHGCILRARRWKGRRGEIDLVFQRGDLLVFVEVKARRSVTYALESLQPAQLARIVATAEEYCAQLPDGAWLDRRVDLAAVEPCGRLKVVPNISM